MQLADRVAQRPIERVHRPVALSGAHVAGAVDPDLDRRLGVDASVGALLGDHPEALELEQRLVLARLAAQQQLERSVSGLVVIAAMLALLDSLDRPLRRFGVEVDPRAPRPREHRALARELGDQHLAAVADQSRVEVLEGPRVGLYPCGVHAALVGEGVAPDVGLIGVGGGVGQLVDEVGGLGQQRQAVGGHALIPHRELQRRQDRDQVGVAASLAVAVDRPLHHPRPSVDRGKRVRDPALGVVVGVDPDLDLVRRARRRRRQSPRRSAPGGSTRWCRRGSRSPPRHRPPPAGTQARSGGRRARRRRSARRRRRPACRRHAHRRPNRRPSPGSRRG